MNILTLKEEFASGRMCLSCYDLRGRLERAVEANGGESCPCYGELGEAIETHVGDWEIPGDHEVVIAFFGKPIESPWMAEEASLPTPPDPNQLSLFVDA